MKYSLRMDKVGLGIREDVGWLYVAGDVGLGVVIEGMSSKAAFVCAIGDSTVTSGASSPFIMAEKAVVAPAVGITHADDKPMCRAVDVNKLDALAGSVRQPWRCQRRFIMGA